MRRKLSVAAILVSGVIALVVGFNQTPYQTQSSDATEQHPLAQYSWQIYDSTSWQINIQTPQNQSLIQAKSIHYKDASKTADFTQPLIIQVTPDKNTSIQSQTAHSTNDFEITFQGKVMMKSLPNTMENGSNKTLTTEKITYNNVSQLLTSDLSVTLAQPDFTISGVGFKGELSTGHYQFFSDVKTEYTPIKASPPQ